MRKLFYTLLCLLLTASSGLCEAVNGITAVVSDEAITALEVSQATAPAAELLYREYRNDVSTLNEKYATARKDNLNQLIDRQMILQEYVNAGYNLPESIIEETIQQRIKQRWKDRLTLTKSLQAEGRTYENWRREMRDQIIIENMIAFHLGKERFVSPKQIETYYDAHLEDYQIEEQIHISMIVLNKQGGTNDPVPALAQELLQQIKQGESFGDLAATYSDGSQARQRGDWGWVERSVLREELADVAFSMQPGQVSEVIETDESCYIMRLEEVKPAHYKPLREVQDEIERTLEAQDRNERREEWMDQLKRKTFIRLF